MRLIKFLKNLSNEIAKIELKNGTFIHGTITGVGVAMNTQLEDVELIVKNQPPVHFDALSVRGESIRCFTLRDVLIIDLPELLANETRRRNRIKRRRARGRGGPSSRRSFAGPSSNQNRNKSPVWVRVVINKTRTYNILC